MNLFKITMLGALLPALTPGRGDDAAATEVRFAAAGYLVVAMAHPRRAPDGHVALCAALEVQPNIGCSAHINGDTPDDVMRTLDWLEAPSEELVGQIDLEVGGVR